MHSWHIEVERREKCYVDILCSAAIEHNYMHHIINMYPITSCVGLGRGEATNRQPHILYRDIFAACEFHITSHLLFWVSGGGVFTNSPFHVLYMGVSYSR